MGRKKTAVDDRPLHAITVKTFDDFHADMAAFAKGKYRFLMVVGPGGTGKTEAAKRLEGCVTISGEPTPFDLYKTVHDAADAPLIFNDVAQSFWTNQKTLALMKQLTETRRVKELQWNSKAPLQEGYPKKFTTESPVLILANRWKTLHEDVRALETRAEATLMWEPTAYEVHKEVHVGGWFRDQAVYDFIYDHLAIIPEASFRWYGTGAALRKARPDKWRSRLLEMMVGDVQMQKVAELLKDKSFASNAKRAKAFKETFGSSERQFYRLLGEFKNWSVAATFGNNFKLRKAG